MENTKQSDPPAETESMVQRAEKAFLRDLAGLLENKKNVGWYALYHADERIAIGPSYAELLNQSKLRAIPPAEIFFAVIHPDASEVEEIENGFYEFDDIEDEPLDGSARTP
jgi:hypothetical protein